MEENTEISFAPILIMEFIRQVTVARALAAETAELTVSFKLAKKYYDEIMAYPLKAQLIRLYLSYDEGTEVLSVKTDEVLLGRFREQKSLMEIAGKYEGQYKERYKNFISVLEQS
ncbi:MAG: hypothetical protein J6J35_03155 [Alphaproteobacteria bacterium]|nr:hypothetical protein [Alphaproteobacteria bacterium]